MSSGDDENCQVKSLLKVKEVFSKPFLWVVATSKMFYFQPETLGK